MQQVDIVVIIVYCLILLGIGIFSSRKETQEGYLLADRELGTFNSTTSIIASKIGGGLVVAGVAYIYTFGVSAGLYFLGAVFGYIIFYFFAKQLKQEADKNKFYTMTDYLENKYGKKGTIWFSVMMFIANLMAFSMQAIGGGKIIEHLTNISFFWSVIIMLSITVIYMVMGGFKAVVFTDIFQFGVILVVFLSIASIFTNQLPNFTVTAFETMNPLLMVAFFVIGIVVPFSTIDLWHRVYATKDVKVLKRSLLLSMLIYSLFGAILSFLGIAISILLPNIDPDIALLEGFIHFLPPEFLVVGVIALMAVLMSSADTAMYSCSSIFIMDILKKKKNLKKYFEWSFPLVAFFGIMVALIFQNIVDLVIIYAILFMMMGYLILMTWIFKLNKKHMPRTYPILVFMTIGLLIIFEIKAELGLAGIVFVPLSYGLSIISSKF